MLYVYCTGTYHKCVGHMLYLNKCWSDKKTNISNNDLYIFKIHCHFFVTYLYTHTLYVRAYGKLYNI